MKRISTFMVILMMLVFTTSDIAFSDKSNTGGTSKDNNRDGVNERLLKDEKYASDFLKEHGYKGKPIKSGTTKDGKTVWFDGKDLYTTEWVGRDSGGNDKEDRDKGSSQPSKPAPPPRPDNEIIIESKDNDTVVWIEREWEFDEPANEWKPVDYKYQVDLITSANIYDADGKQKNKVTVKAGYGIKVDGSSRFEMKQIAGTKKDSIAGFKQTLPTKGSVTTEFAVKKNIAQDKTLNLESKGKGSFVTAKNSGSKTGAKVVYTDIYQKDGSYNVVVKLYEAKLSGQVLGEHLMSQSNTLSFKIKGSMYEDSYVKPTDSTKNKNNTGFEPITFDNGFN